MQVVADGKLANYETEIKHLDGRLQRHRRRRSQSLARQGAGHRGARQRASSCTAGPIPKPIRCKRSGTRSSSCARSPTCGRGPTRSARSPACATASAARSTTSSRSTAFSTSTRRSSPPATAKGPARCSGSRRSTWPSCRKQDGEVDYTQDFFDRPAYLTVSGQLEGRDLRLRAGQGLHVRPDVPRRELQHVAAPGRVLDGRAGDGVLRADRQHGPGRGVPEAHLPRRAGAVRRGHGVLQRAHRQDGDRDARRRSSTSEFVRLPYTEAVEILREVGQEVRVPGRLGQRPAGRARALPDREALQAAGDPVRLSAHDQAVLHARQRRRQNGAGDGRAGAQGRRDHRRQPARGAARRARSSG